MGAFQQATCDPSVFLYVFPSGCMYEAQSQAQGLVLCPWLCNPEMLSSTFSPGHEDLQIGNHRNSTTFLSDLSALILSVQSHATFSNSVGTFQYRRCKTKQAASSSSADQETQDAKIYTDDGE